MTTPIPPPLTWANFYPTCDPPASHWWSCETHVLLRHVAAAEYMMMTDPVRARSRGEERFRTGLAALYAELDSRVPRED